MRQIVKINLPKQKYNLLPPKKSSDSVWAQSFYQGGVRGIGEQGVGLEGGYPPLKKQFYDPP